MISGLFPEKASTLARRFGACRTTSTCCLRLRKPCGESFPTTATKRKIVRADRTEDARSGEQREGGPDEETKAKPFYKSCTLCKKIYREQRGLGVGGLPKKITDKERATSHPSSVVENKILL